VIRSDLKSGANRLFRTACRIPLLVLSLTLIVAQTAYADIPPPRPGGDPPSAAVTAGANNGWIPVVVAMVLVVLVITAVSILMRRSRLRH
jgi:hypothetical protein